MMFKDRLKKHQSKFGPKTRIPEVTIEFSVTVWKLLRKACATMGFAHEAKDLYKMMDKVRRSLRCWVKSNFHAFDKTLRAERFPQ